MDPALQLIGVALEVHVALALLLRGILERRIAPEHLITPLLDVLRRLEYLNLSWHGTRLPGSASGLVHLGDDWCVRMLQG